MGEGVAILLRRKDGSTFPVESVNNSIIIDGKRLNCAFTRDISRVIEQEKALSRQKEILELENDNVRRAFNLSDELDIVGVSRLHQKTLNTAKKAAQSDAPILIMGESGSGKELIAQFIHGISTRHEHKMVSLNCAALTDNDIISRLFGHVKGAYTGADQSRSGVFTLADNSSLFLNEVGELSLDVQAKLLRVLQEGTFTKMGGEVTESSNVRIIAATNRNLPKMVREGRFRQDLYFRLATFEVPVHPLRNRKVDIIPLINHRLAFLNRKYRKDKTLPPDAELKPLISLSLPGNVRELYSLVERAYHYSEGNELKFPQAMIIKASGAEDMSSELGLPTLDQVQADHIRRVLDYCDWKISGTDGAAAILDLNPSTLRSKMKKLGIKR